ncbi:hypothetical protein PISMIDRAFT_680896 [Pisolithus microcarpus 441]|uniref:Pentacotripeptide-repeat region of PRORP domain-containing protein n=1 Tax=Pisolithus microcarpus 441 TaxID=765257 RepID=A0A0C9Z7G4_9AGAM|nr:hypothetical protein PISMIDRAFT_680896 [Pisolithus microcarpus 441]
MLPKVTSHLFLHTSRAVALVQNQSGTLRNVLQHQSSGSTTSTAPWTTGPGSSWGGAGTGAGPGGAKFNAGSKFYTGYTGAGRAVTQANASAGQDLIKDDDKEDVSTSAVKSRQSSSHHSRPLARRHSFTLPSGPRDPAQETSTGVLHSVQLHLRARHTFAPSAEHEQQNRRQPSPPQPSLTADDSSQSSFAISVEEAFATKNIPRLAQLIVELTDRDHDVQKSLRSIDARARRRRLGAQTSSLIDEAAAEEADSKGKDSLLAEDNFRSAMSIFDAACITSESDSGNPQKRSALAFRFPVNVYHALLRSCAYYACTDAALRVYSHLEARVRQFPTHGPETSTPFYPSTTAIYYLLSTYVNANDFVGATEVFNEFKDLCARKEIANLEPSSNVRVWNKMIEAYFRAGQPAGALRLLETMMDAESSDKTQGEKVLVPSPASSTFTTIINGFCSQIPNDPIDSGTAPTPSPQPDVATALSWFNRLLLQPNPSIKPYDPSSEPTRPDQKAWTVMLEMLSQAVSTDKSRIQDLNRLFGVLVECAAKDSLVVMPTLRSMVLSTNVRFLEQATDSEDKDLVHASLAFLVHHLSSDKDRRSSLLETQALLASVYPQFVRFGMAEKAWELAKGLVAQELSVIEESLKKDEKAEAKISGQLLNKVIPLALEAIFSSSSETSAPSETLQVMRYAVRIGVKPTSATAPYFLHAFILSPIEIQRDLTQQDYEFLLSCALALPVNPSNNELPQGCAYQSLTALLKIFDDAGIASHVQAVPKKLALAIMTALQESLDAHQLAEFFRTVGPVFQRFKRPPPPPAPATESPASRAPVIVDSEISHYIDEWYPSNRSLTVHDGYARLQEAISAPSPRYPHPTTLGRLINGLGRARDVPALQSVYDTAQQVIFSPHISANPPWQSQAWFQIEDQMIVAYAHAGDMERAYMHRDRISAAGGVPSPDAYGSLIECVRDTTDDTSNAMALFTECQMRGTKPNVYLYNTIISKLAKARKADFALDLFEQMKTTTSLRPSSITYGAVIAACARVGDTQAAERLFEEMAGQPNFKPRIPPYNTMMQMYTHTKPDRGRVLHYYDLMLKAGIKPSAHTYKLLIDAYGTIEPIDIEAAEETFKKVESSAETSLQSTHWAALINAYGCVLKDLDKAISVFDSIASHPSARRNPLNPIPDAVTYESLINVFVIHKRMDHVRTYLAKLQASGVHMTAYIANLLIKGYSTAGDIEEARRVFESLADPPSGVAAPNNHVPHNPASTSSVSSTGPSYREPSTWEAMFRAELGNGHRDRAVALLDRLRERQFPHAVYQRIRGIMGDDDSVTPWAQSPSSQSL